MLFAAVLALSAFALPPLPDMSHAEAVYFYNVAEKKVMAEKNASATVYPASTVKLMTGLVAIEAIGDRLDETVTVNEEMLKNVSGNKIKLKAGERVTFNDLLYATVCGCANDAASVLAYAVSGDMESFVALMNKRAAELGAIDTNYTNVTGIHHKDMVTTAYDTFIIAMAASQNSLFAEISSESKYVMPETNLSGERNIYNKNSLISRYTEKKYYNKYAVGLNAGSTTQGGYCLAACSKAEGGTYICVVLGADETDGNINSYTIANELINWAYSSYGYVQVISEDMMVCEVGVELSEDVDYVTLKPKSSLTVFLPLETDLKTELVYNHTVSEKKLEAPVEEGQAAGFITVSLNGEALGTVELVTMNKVDRSEFLYTLKQIRDFTASRPFIITVIAFIVLLAAYIFGTAVYRAKPARRRRKHR